MALTISVSIGAVDGETRYRLTTSCPQEALGFLAQYDHEGSDVAVTVRVHDEAYTLLQALLPVKPAAQR